MPPARPFSCQECSRAFTRSVFQSNIKYHENLERHKRTHHDNATAPRFKCHICQARFARKDVCKRHSVNCDTRSQAALTRVEIDPPAGSDGPGNLAEDDALEDMNLSDTDVQLENFAHNWDNILIATSTIADNTSWRSPSADMTLVHIKSYIRFFHPSLPILHLQSLAPDKTPSILLKIVVAIGCLHSAGRHKLVDADQDRRWSHNVWESGCYELEAFVKGDYQKLRTTWVLQSWLLYILYGNFTGDAKRISKSREMYMQMTDAVRDFGLLHQKSVISKPSVWDSSLELPISEEEICHRWQTFVSQEGTKLLLYGFYYLDYHLFASCNIRPNISSIEFEWDLPVAKSLWQATTANSWWNAVRQRENEFKELSENANNNEPKAQTRSLLAATQALMSKTASPWLMKVLEQSPFASLCIVANIDCLVRDFTRCYYQLPPTLADPSPFHVLTQHQNSQVAAALNSLSSFKDSESCNACNESCKSLWHAVLLGCLSIKISLCKPDELLVGGIIELNPAAGLATSVHLSLGNFVSTRRADSTSRKRLIAEDGFMTILDDLLKAVHLMGREGKSAPWEGPWTTVQGLKILIILLQVLRFSIAELKSEIPDTQMYPKIYQPARNAVTAIISILDIYDAEAEHMSHEFLSAPDGLENIDQLESELITWMIRICDRRDVWDIGPSMSKVLDEIRAMNLEDTVIL